MICERKVHATHTHWLPLEAQTCTLRSEINRRQVFDILMFPGFNFSCSCYCCWVAQSCQTFCSPRYCSTRGLPVPHHLLRSAQVHVPCISGAFQPSHALTPSSPSALNLSQHQGLFQWDGCSHQMTKNLELQLPHQSFQRVLRVDFPWDWLVWSPCCPRNFQEPSSTTVQRH